MAIYYSNLKVCRSRIEDLLLSGNGGGACDPDLGLKVSATITATTDNFVVDTLLYEDIDVVGTPENPVYHAQLEYLFSVSHNGTVYSGVIHGQASTAGGVGPLPVITGTLYQDRFAVDFGEGVSEAIALQVTVFQTGGETDPGLRTTTATYLDSTSWTIAVTNEEYVVGGFTVTVPAGLYSNNQEAEEEFPYGLT